jgi:dCMP deaminase
MNMDMSKMNINKYLNLAQIEANKSTWSEYRIGAVIVQGKKIVGSGYNRSSGKLEQIINRLNLQSKVKLSVWSLHAEMDALLNAGDEAEGAVMFVSGIKINGNAINCRPCKICAKLIKEYGIKQVYYSTKEGIETLYD